MLINEAINITKKKIMKVTPQLRLFGSTQIDETKKPIMDVSINDESKGAGFQFFNILITSIVLMNLI